MYQVSAIEMILKVVVPQTLSQADDLLVKKTSSFLSNFEIALCFEGAE